jgi:hypothetical protein
VYVTCCYRPIPGESIGTGNRVVVDMSFGLGLRSGASFVRKGMPSSFRNVAPEAPVDDLRVIRGGQPIPNIEETNLDADGNEKVILTARRSSATTSSGICPTP